MFHITRIVLAAAAVAAGLSGVRADERLRVVELPRTEGGAFLHDALYPEMRGAHGPVEIRISPNAAVPPVTALPFQPHFGASVAVSGTDAQVDGIFFSPADGVELTARPGLDRGFSGLLGVTVRF